MRVDYDKKQCRLCGEFDAVVLNLLEARGLFTTSPRGRERYTDGYRCHQRNSSYPQDAVLVPGGGLAMHHRSRGSERQNEGRSTVIETPGDESASEEQPIHVLKDASARTYRITACVLALIGVLSVPWTIPLIQSGKAFECIAGGVLMALPVFAVAAIVSKLRHGDCGSIEIFADRIRVETLWGKKDIDFADVLDISVGESPPDGAAAAGNLALAAATLSPGRLGAAISNIEHRWSVSICIHGDHLRGGKLPDEATYSRLLEIVEKHREHAKGRLPSFLTSGRSDSSDTSSSNDNNSWYAD